MSNTQPRDTFYHRLYINDYNLESNTVKRQAMIALVGRINSSGILIDGIGAEFRDVSRN